MLISTGYRLPVIALAMFLWVAPAGADDDDDDDDGRREDALKELMLCYAEGTDAIGNLHARLGSLQERIDAARAEGLEVYNTCFVPNALFEAWFPNQPVTDWVAPDADVTPPGVSIQGTEAWMDFVATFFHAVYDGTQHHIGNIRVNWDGNRAQIVAYLIATHVKLGAMVGSTTVSACSDVATGTYTLDARYKKGGWKVTRLRLTLINFDPVYEPDPGGCARVM